MLPGGLQVLGLYLYAPPNIAQHLQDDVHQLAHRLCCQSTLDSTVQSWMASSNSTPAQGTTAIIVQVCSSSKKTSVRTLDTSDRQATLKPAELKYHTFVQNWTEVHCAVSLNEDLHVDKSVGSISSASSISTDLSSFARRLSLSSAAVVSDHSRLFRNDEELLVARTSGRSSRTPLQIEFWERDADEEDTVSSSPSQCRLRICGTVCGRAYLHDKATVLEAVSHLKLDILRSISTRLQLLSEDMQEELSPSAPVVDNKVQKAPVKQQSFVCPQRCFVVLNGGSPTTVCDYIFADEQPSACLERISEMFGAPVKEESCLLPESFPASPRDCLKVMAASSAVLRKYNGVTDDIKSTPGWQRPQLSACTTVVSAVLAVAIAGLAGLVLSEYS